VVLVQPALSTLSVVFLSTVVAAIAVTAIEAVSLFIIGGLVSRSLIPTAEKHEKIKLLADKNLT